MPWDRERWKGSSSPGPYRSPVTAALPISDLVLGRFQGEGVTLGQSCPLCGFDFLGLLWSPGQQCRDIEVLTVPPCEDGPRSRWSVAHSGSNCGTNFAEEFGQLHHPFTMGNSSPFTMGNSSTLCVAPDALRWSMDGGWSVYTLTPLYLSTRYISRAAGGPTR